MSDYSNSGILNQWINHSFPQAISFVGDSIGEAAKLPSEIAHLALSIITGGVSQAINASAEDYRPSEQILRKLYLSTLAFLAPPLAEPKTEDEMAHNILQDERENFRVIAELAYKDAETSQCGAASQWVKDNIFEKAITLSQDENPLTRYIMSRLCNLVGTVAIVVTKVCELALGIFLAALSLATFGGLYGTWSWINENAYRYLGALDVIHEVLDGLRLTINPQQKWDWTDNLELKFDDQIAR